MPNLRNDLPFSTDIAGHETTDLNHASNFNRPLNQLTSNDSFLAGEVDKIKRNIAEGFPAKGGNADTVDDCHAGTNPGDVLKLNSKGKVPEITLKEALKEWWQPSMVYSLGEMVKPFGQQVPFIYICTQAGTTNATPPNWLVEDGKEIMDGTVKWEAVLLTDAKTLDGRIGGTAGGNLLVLDSAGRVPIAVLSHIINQNKIIETYLTNAVKKWWRPSTSYVVGNTIDPIGALNGQFYECITAGTTGTAEPAWLTTNNTEFTDGTVKWRARTKESLGGYVGKIEFPTFVVQENHLKLNGALLLRASYPKLWEFAQSNGIVATEADWQVVDATTSLQLKSGLFSSGDGSTTFRLPDHRGMFYRVLDEGRGMDADGSGRSLGQMQEDAIRNLIGNLGVYTHTGYTGTGVFKLNMGATKSQPTAGNGNYRDSNIDFNLSNVVPIGDRNRPVNIGLFATIQYK